MADTTQVYERGKFDLKFSKINDAGTGYDETINTISGLMEVSITFKQESAIIAADDNTDYASFYGPLTGEGTLKLVTVPFAQYQNLMAVIEDTNSVLIFGSNENPVPLGMTFKTTGSDKSYNKFTINKVYLDTPSINTVSLNKTDLTIRDFEIPIRVEPFYYTKTDESTGRVTYSLINSSTHASIWTNVKDKIYIPDQSVVA